MDKNNHFLKYIYTFEKITNFRRLDILLVVGYPDLYKSNSNCGVKIRVIAII